MQMLGCSCIPGHNPGVIPVKSEEHDRQVGELDSVVKRVGGRLVRVDLGGGTGAEQGEGKLYILDEMFSSPGQETGDRRPATPAPPRPAAGHRPRPGPAAGRPRTGLTRPGLPPTGVEYFS